VQSLGAATVSNDLVFTTLYNRRAVPVTSARGGGGDPQEVAYAMR
jgi:hypothetical protein